MLELRFNILDPYVDKFVITESKYSHSGEKKKLNFDINKFEEGACIFTTQVSNPEEFGGAEMDSDGNVLSIEEKPTHPKSNRALIGIYFFDNRCIEYAKQLVPSKRKEIEIVDLCKKYLDNQELRVNNLTRTMTWIDAGTFKSLLLASNLICNLEEIQSYKISCPEEVAYKNGWIDKEQLLTLAATYPKGEYQSYLNLLPSL